MAGTKFQYDENGTTFYCFVLTFMALVVIPMTYFYWPRTKTEDEPETNSKKKKCHCDACVVKQKYMKSKEPSKKVKEQFIKLGIVIAWGVLIAFAYKVAHIQPDYVTFDPFEILGISAGASKSEIKKAYHKMSLVYHPDKKTGNEKLFMKVSKAYAALTDEAARQNWEEYGNPDGPGAMSFGIALPSWIVEKENSMIVLMVYALLLMIAMPIGVRIWWSNSSKYGGGFKVLLDTTQMFYFYIHKTQTMNLHRILKVITSSYEFNKEHNSEVQERPSDNKEIPKLIKEVADIVPDQRDYPYSIKARALLYAHMLRIPLSQNTLEVDKKYVLAKCPYLIQEFVQCATQLTLLALTRRIPRTPSLETIENAMKLNALLVQGLMVNKNALLQLPHVSEDMLRHFINRKRNIRNMQQLAQLEDSERRQMLRVLSDEEYEDVVEFIGHMPLLDVNVRSQVLDDEDGCKITAGALVTVSVTITRRDMCVLFNKSATLIESTLETEELANDQENQKPSSTKQPTKQTKVWAKTNNAKVKKNKGKKNKPAPIRGRQNQNPKIDQTASTMAGKAANSELVSLAGDTNEKAENESRDIGSPANAGTHENGDANPSASHDEEKDSDDDIQPDAPKKDVFKVMSKISHSVHCPYFPEDKQEHWWIYIAERKSQSLTTAPYFLTNLVEKEEVELVFTAPVKPGAYQYTVQVRCDSYVEMDYSAPLKLLVHAAPKPIKDHPQWEDVSSDESEDSSSCYSSSGSTDSDGSWEEVDTSVSSSSYDHEENYELAE